MSNSYLLLDAARCGMNAVESAQALCNSTGRSLYDEGDKNDYLAAVGPFIFEATAGLQRWYAENGFGNAWGLMVTSTRALEDCRKHFKQFLVIKEKGGSWFFRFYDPRVIKGYLPACNKEQLQQFFGPVDAFVAEGDNPGEEIRFSRQQGLLQTTKNQLLNS